MAHIGKLDLSFISPEKVIEAQWNALKFKKESIKGRVCLRNLFYRDFPDYRIYCRNISAIEALRKNWRTLLNANLSTLLYRKKLINLIKSLVAHI
jgi:hypothetical protein